MPSILPSRFQNLGTHLRRFGNYTEVGVRKEQSNTQMLVEKKEKQLSLML